MEITSAPAKLPPLWPVNGLVLSLALFELYLGKEDRTGPEEYSYGKQLIMLIQFLEDTSEATLLKNVMGTFFLASFDKLVFH